MSRDRAAWLSGRARRLRPLAQFWRTPQNSQNIAQKGNGLRALHAKEALNVSKNPFTGLFPSINGNNKNNYHCP
jgi:hypothetical protein